MIILSGLALLAAANTPAYLPAATAATALVQSSRVLGGYNSADVNNAQVQAAAAFAAASVDGELGEVTSAQVQSAAGSNYRISFTTSDGRSYDAVVRRDLQGAYSVTTIEETGDHGSNEASEDGEE